LRQRRVQVLVRLAFDDQNAKPKALDVLDGRIVEVRTETFGDLWNCQCGKLSTQPADFSIESVSLVAAADERFASLSIERLRAGPNPEPREAICFGEELMGIGVLRERRRAQDQERVVADGIARVAVQIRDPENRDHRAVYSADKASTLCSTLPAADLRSRRQRSRLPREFEARIIATANELGVRRSTCRTLGSRTWSLNLFQPARCVLVQ
jgi:hypothetical protein